MRGPIAGFHGHLITAAVAVAVAACFLGALLVASGALRGLEDRYHVRALVPSGAGLAEGASVRTGGLKVGEVTTIRRAGNAAMVEFDLDEDRAPIPSDSRVGVRLRTLIGENYLELDPGDSAKALPDDGVLALSTAKSYVEIDTVLSTLKGPTRQRARAFVQSLGEPLAGRGEKLNRLVANASGVLTSGASVWQVLAHDRAQLARLVRSLGSITNAVGERGAAVARLARQSRATFEALAKRDDAMRAMADELPSTVRQVRRSSGVLRSVSRQATPVIGRLAGAVGDLRPAVQRLRPAAVHGRALLRELGRSSPPLSATVRRLRRASGPLAAFFPQLRQVLCEANPAIDLIAPFTPEITSTISALGSGTNLYDATGHVARVYALASENSFVGYPAKVSRAADVLMSTGLLNKVHDLGYNAYPDQGTIGRFTKGRDATGPSDVTTKYPRIEADC